jgi:uncharacterized Zn finger protein
VNGKPMEVLRCQSCGGEVGLKSAGYTPDPETVVVRCLACAAVEEAEAITGAAPGETEQTP